MGSLLLLLALCVVMALASFFAGALPLSISLSQSQLRLISSIGVGILVGTSLIVIIPEGIEAVASTGLAAHISTSAPRIRSIAAMDSLQVARGESEVFTRSGTTASGSLDALYSKILGRAGRDPKDEVKVAESPSQSTDQPHTGLPTFWIGLSLMSGFVLMYLVDRLPRHATESLKGGQPTTHHVSLDDLGTSSVTGEEDGDGFLESLTPPPKHTRSLATTTGLVIHAAADGIAMGASATTEDMKLGFIIFAAIMIHKAPAAFGLTSILLKQGLSKRAARGHLIVFSLAAPVGALATFILVSVLGGGKMEGEAGQWWTGMLLLFSGGTFLYVAMHAMQEEGTSHGHDHQSSTNGYSDNGGSAQRRQNRPQMRDTLATVGGMLLPLLTQFGHEH